MRIVFMGTPAFAAKSLQKLIDEGYEIPLVVTQPDRKATAIKWYCPRSESWRSSTA